jgi:predicted NBD/HSP70 family sugar kinase
LFPVDTNHILVFDVGGSHIAASLFHRGRLDTDVHSINVTETSNEEGFLQAFASLAKAILPDSAHPRGIAVAIPNPFDCEAGVSFMRHKYGQLYGKNLRHGLAEWVGCDPSRIHFLNDAAAFLLGEMDQGAVRGVDRVIGITLGTGVGSAFACGGKIAVNGRGVPPNSEIWNLRYRGATVEDFISSRAIRQLYEQQMQVPAEVRDIASLGAGDVHVRETFQRFGRDLGAVLRQTCLDFAPQRIVLGGGISRAAELFLPAASQELADPSIELWVSALFERAPLIGAGLSWNSKFGKLREPEPSPVAEEP